MIFGVEEPRQLGLFSKQAECRWGRWTGRDVSEWKIKRRPQGWGVGSTGISVLALPCAGSREPRPWALAPRCLDLSLAEQPWQTTYTLSAQFPSL